MTSSTTSSSSRKAEIVKILEDIANSNISLYSGVALLPDYVKSYRSQGESRRIQFTELEVDVMIPIGQPQLMKAFTRYLSGESSARELSEWATFMLGESAFVPEGDEEVWEQDDINLVWDIIQRLATPSIFAEISPETVHNYIEMISH